jgi:hypothetical protein
MKLDIDASYASNADALNKVKKTEKIEMSWTEDGKFRSKEYAEQLHAIDEL